MKRQKQTRVRIFMACVLSISGTLLARKYPFQNPNLSIEERVDNIISLLTLDEKIACLSADPSVSRLDLKGTRHVEGLHGLAKGGPSNWGQRDPVTTTIFPQAIGLAESWDPEVLKRVASIESYETRYIFQSPKYRKGGLVVRAPNADLGRDPRWGRTEECYGEDAWFNGTMTVAFVKGLQGDNPKYWRTASLMKHFLANSNENGRSSSSSNFDERLLREYYSYPFWRGIIEGGSCAYMASYNAYNGIPMTVNPILKDITINEWGLNGIICTDGGAFSLLVTDHKYYPNLNKAAAACIRAGINQFLDRTYREGVDGALADGYMTEATIDSVLKGNFMVMIKLGLLDPPEMVPYSSIGISDTTDPWLTEENQLTAREITQKTIVLLKNSKNLLPLDKGKIKSIAVIGPHADEVLLDWYSGTPPYTISLLAGIKNKVGDAVEVKYAKDNTDGAAVTLAKTADVAIVCVGNHPTCDSAPFGECPTPSDGKEAVDRRIIILEQEKLIKEVYSANPNTIVILVSSFPYAINWTQENVPAILHMTHASQEMGNALADVLFGDYNPGGRLVQTWPKSMDQLPPMMEYDIRKGHTYMYFKGEPLFPFGFGLSYTTFSYSNLKVSSIKLKSDGGIIVRVTIQNSGNRTGDEVVQLYVKHLNSKIDRPLKEIKGFKRVTLKPNESRIVEIPLKAEILAYWDVKKHCFMVEEDRIQIMVGTSSSDTRLRDTIDVVH
jgi:beta-glucosidase